MKTLLTFFIGGSGKLAWAALGIVRFAVGWIFIFAGIRKFTEPDEMGVGRFAELGLPIPEFLGPFVGFFELFGGLFLVLGLFTRAAAIPLICTMIVAIITTKLPEFAGEGIVEGLHQWRLDFTLLLLSIFLFIAGGGKWALDRVLPWERERERR